MTPQQRQRLEALVAKSAGDGRRHVTVTIDTLAELLGVANQAPSEPTEPTTPAASPDPETPAPSTPPASLEAPTPTTRRRKPKP